MNWLVIELGRDIMPTNIFTKFDKDLMKTLSLRERKPCGRCPPARRRCSHNTSRFSGLDVKEAMKFINNADVRAETGEEEENKYVFASKGITLLA